LPIQRRDRNQHLSRSQRHSRRSAPAGPPERDSAGWTHCAGSPRCVWCSTTSPTPCSGPRRRCGRPGGRLGGPPL